MTTRLGGHDTVRRRLSERFRTFSDISLVSRRGTAAPGAWRDMKVQKSQQRNGFLISKQLSREVRGVPEAGTTLLKLYRKHCGRTSF